MASIFAAEHAAELQGFQRRTQALNLGSHIVDSGLVFFFSRHFQQVAGIAQTAAHFIQGIDDLRQLGALATQILGVLGIVPDVWVFQFAVNFDQPIMLVIVVKDTPE